MACSRVGRTRRWGSVGRRGSGFPTSALASMPLHRPRIDDEARRDSSSAKRSIPPARSFYKAEAVDKLETLARAETTQGQTKGERRPEHGRRCGANDPSATDHAFQVWGGLPRLGLLLRRL